MLSWRFWVTVLAVIVGFANGALARTLTAADGRTIEADVTGFEGDKVSIKRADSGQAFTLPISSFAEADQVALRAEAEEAAKQAAKPVPLRDGDIQVELSRVRFGTRKSSQDVTMADGSISKDLLAITEDDWGYTITLKNNTRRRVEGLRAEYILYTKVDVIDKTNRSPSIRRKGFALVFEPVPLGGRVSAKSEAVVTRKTELRGGYVWGGTGDKDTRDTLHGIWLRVYQGDTLVLEVSSPDGLRTSEKWLER